MIPLYFGKADRQLFGAYDPTTAPDLRQGVVLCNPWGQEYLLSHQSMRYLAKLLSDSGFHVLRFDYYGTGDSAGESVECTVASCLEGINLAIEELKETAGVSLVHLVGLRLGAPLAAIAATKRNDVGRLVLWDPISGADFLKDVGAVAEGSSPEQLIEANGFPLSEVAVAGLRELALPAGSRRPTMLVAAAGDDADTPIGGLTDDATQLSGTVTYRGPRIWLLSGDLGVSGMPVDALHAIKAWLLEERA